MQNRLTKKHRKKNKGNIFVLLICFYAGRILASTELEYHGKLALAFEAVHNICQRPKAWTLLFCKFYIMVCLISATFFL